MSELIQPANLPPEVLPPFPRAGLRKTVVCRDKQNGRTITINQCDLGSEKFPENRFFALNGEELDELDLERSRPKQKPVTHSLYSKEDLNLKTMRIDHLKKLPEYELIPEDVRKRLRTKQQHIDALLQARVDVPETPKTRASF